MTNDDFSTLRKQYSASDIVASVRLVRQHAGTLEQIVTENWAATDPTRQVFRRVIRHLVDAPDIDWPAEIRPQ